MAKVKCRYCKKQIPKETAYVVETLNKQFNVSKKYYCSEECFNNELNGKKIKEQKIQEMENFRELTKAEVKNILDISLEKNLYFTNLYNDLENTYGIETINNYIKHEKQYLIDILNRNYFETTYSKIKYFFTIVQNNIDKYVKREDIQETKEINNNLIDDFDLSTPIKSKKKRSLNDIMKGV